MIRPAALLILTLPLALGACVTPASYPSLALRDTEKGADAPKPATPDRQAQPPSDALRDKVARLLTQADGNHNAFIAQREAAQRAVAAARGSGVASDSWVAAQVALAGLESARSGALTALAELDQLYADERIAWPEAVSPSAALLGSARDRVKAWIEEENATIAELVRQMGG